MQRWWWHTPLDLLPDGGLEFSKRAKTTTGRRNNKVDSLGFLEDPLRLAFIVSGVVLATTVVTVIAAYVLNKLNRS
jgi:hypothetical protein